MFGREPGLCVRAGTGSVLPLISRPENMKSRILHYILAPTKVVIPSPLLWPSVSKQLQIGKMRINLDEEKSAPVISDTG